MSLKAIHDQLVTIRPEGATCPDDCPFCNEVEVAIDHLEGGTNVSKTFTEEEVQALVAAAVAESAKDMQAKIDSFESSQQSQEVEARIASAKAELETQISELQQKLDESVLAAEQAKTERDEISAWLTAEAEKQSRESELAACKEDRVAKVAEVVTFPEEYVKERSDSWASLDDETFEALLADYRAIGERAGESAKVLPKFTAMQATRESDKAGSAAREVIQMRSLGIDPRVIR